MKVLHNSCNTVTRGLPDISTLSPWASGVHIRQTTHDPYIIFKDHARIVLKFYFQ